MPYVENTILVDGNADDVYQLASDMESYPQFMENVRSVEVLERAEDTTVTAWETEVDGREISWKERDYFDKQQQKIYYEQIEGDLEEFKGQWKITAQKEATQVTLSVEFEFGIPMLGPVLNPILKKKVASNSEAMLKAIKEEVEGQES